MHFIDAPGSILLLENSLSRRRPKSSLTLAMMGCAVMWCACPLAQPPTPTMKTTNTKEIAARLVPLPMDERGKVLDRLPHGSGKHSQLAGMLEGSWYLHRGDLAIDGNFENGLNLVVDGDITVRGTLTEGGDGASLVVLGDLRAQNVLTSHLMVVAGSLECSGIVHGDYNDYSLEVYGDKLKARAGAHGSFRDAAGETGGGIRARLEFRERPGAGGGCVRGGPGAVAG